ncbi:MAG TPA: SLBB domain-containing protein [Candidatus Binatia bacterium]|nr:SLBB domain-containing protein [Candidatus Binatia bacterium]
MTLRGRERALGLGLISCAVVLLAGCFSDPNPHDRFVFPGSDPPGQAANGLAATPDSGASFSGLRKGDLITVTFSDVPLPGIVPQIINIPDGGIVTLPYNVHVLAAGKTTTELEKDIRDAYVPALFVNLTVTVKAEKRAFFVDGEVKQSGRQEYIGEMTVLRAIGTAGGFTDFANRKKIELRRQGGQKFFINYYKALDDEQLDLPVYPNDHIVVKRSIW